LRHLFVLETLQPTSFNMALSPSLISSNIKAATPSVNGVDWIKMCQALGLAIYKEIVNPISVNAQGITTGSGGVGTIPTGKMFFAPIPDMKGHLTANGVNGQTATEIAIGCISGTTVALNIGCEYYGTSLGVGIGGDIAKVVYANPVKMIQSIQSCCVAFGLNGVVSKQVAIGVGNGISSILLSGTGVGAVVGSGSPSFTTGTSKTFLR